MGHSPTCKFLQKGEKGYVRYIILTILTIISISNISGQKFKEFKTNSIFNDYFKHEKDISFPKEIVIGGINSIAAYGENLVVVDPICKKAYVLNKNGKIVKTLNPEECSPGTKWKPFESYYNRQGKIYIMNPPGGFIFGTNGECLKPMNATFLSSQSFCYLTNKNIIGYYLLGNNKNLLKLMDENGKEIKKYADFPNEFVRLDNIWRAGGVVSDKYDNVYLERPSTPQIIKYDKYGNIVNKFNYRSPDFRRITDDLRPNEDYGKGFERVTDGKSHLEKIFLLDEDKLLIVAYYKYTKIGMGIYDLNGNKLSSEEIICNMLPIMARSGYLYFIYQPPFDKTSEIPNPVIKVFKLKQR